MQQELILNPSKLYNQNNIAPDDGKVCIEQENNSTLNLEVCWICYDNEKRDIFIKPCHCKGDVSSVHQECLRRWLMQKISKNKTSTCEICGYEYILLRSDNKLKWKNELSRHHMGIIALMVACICLSVTLCWILVHLYDNFYIQVFCITIAILVIHCCFGFLGKTVLRMYQSAKVAALDISDQTIKIKNTNDAVPV